MSALDGFFNPDSKFSVFMGRMFDLMVLNLIFMVMCVPVFTIGANITAVYYVTLKMARNKESYIWKAYWKSFRENFVQGTIIGLITMAVGLLLGLDLYLVKFLKASPAVITGLKYLFLALLVVFLFYYTFIFPLLAKFANTTKRTIINAMLMSIRHLPYTLLMIAITISPIVVFIFLPMFASYVLIFMVLLGFSTLMLANSKFLVKIFDMYIPSEEEEITPDEEFSIEETDEDAMAIEDRETVSEDDTDEEVTEDSDEDDSEAVPDAE